MKSVLLKHFDCGSLIVSINDVPLVWTNQTVVLMVLSLLAGVRNTYWSGYRARIDTLCKRWNLQRTKIKHTFYLSCIVKRIACILESGPTLILDYTWTNLLFTIIPTNVKNRLTVHATIAERFFAAPIRAGWSREGGDYTLTYYRAWRGRRFTLSIRSFSNCGMDWVVQVVRFWEYRPMNLGILFDIIWT